MAKLHKSSSKTRQIALKNGVLESTEPIQTPTMMPNSEEEQADIE